MPLLAYLLVFVALAAPWLAELARAVPAQPSLEDAHVLPWVLAWVTHALAVDPSALYDANVSYPAPRQLTGTDPVLAAQALFAPLFAASGNAVLAANLTALLAYPLGAFAMERLLRRFGVAPAIAWAVGLVFALGALRVPFNLNALAYPNLFLPWSALALTRLRDEPSIRRAAVLLLAFGTGLFAGLYAAVLLCAAMAVWGLFELARPEPDRWGFAALALGTAAVAALLFLLAMQPYLATRGSAGGQPMPLRLGFGDLRSVLLSLYLMLGLHAQSVRLHVRSLGESLVLIVAGLAAIAVWLARARRAGRSRETGPASLVPRAAVLWLVFAILSWGYPGPLAAVVARTPLGAFRYVYRWVVVAELGAVLLLAAALGAAAARLGPRAARVAAAALVALVLWQRGVPLATTEMHRVAALSPESRAVYAQVESMVRAQGGGALLELPIYGRLPGVADARTLEPDAMLGSTLHWLATPAAHLSYHAPHRAFFLSTVSNFARPSALEELHDATRVRWLLFRPVAFWLPGERQPVLERVASVPGVERVWQSPDGWLLFRVDRTPRHEQWFETIARGGVPGQSVLGAPLAPIPEDEAKATVRISELTHDAQGARLDLLVRVRNEGGRTWPVVPPPLTPLTLDGRWGAVFPRDGTVMLVARWYDVDASGARRTESSLVRRHPLRRDVDPAEEIEQLVSLPVPASPGLYELELHVEQVGGAQFTLPGNAPERRRLPVGIAAASR